MNRHRIVRALIIGLCISIIDWGLEWLFPSTDLTLLFQTNQLFYPSLIGSLWRIALFALAFSALSGVYDWLDLRLLGNRAHKVLTFVACEAILWLIYLAEPLPHATTSGTASMMLKALIIFLCQFYFLYLLLATEKRLYERKPFMYGRALLIFTACFMVGRGIGYYAFDLYHMPAPFEGFSLFWSAVMGLSIGVVFCLLQRYFSKQDKKPKTLQFAIGFFFTLSLTYHLWLYLRAQLAVYDLLGRVLFDTFAVLLATWLTLQNQINVLTDYKLDGEH